MFLSKSLENKLKPDVIDDTNPDDIYLGYFKRSSERCHIKRITKADALTTIKYPVGRFDFAFNWDQRATYEYRFRDFPIESNVLLLEFQTNSSNTTTFDPTIVSTSDDYLWDLGDGTEVIGKAVSHTYADATTKTVKLYGPSGVGITGIDVYSDKIVGELNLSNDVFRKCSSWILYVNAEMTSAIFPPIVDVPLTMLRLPGCGIIGNIDLSMFNELSNAEMNVSGNPLLTGIITPNFINGTISSLQISSCKIVEVLDLTMFKDFSDMATISVGYNPLMTNVLFHPEATGNIDYISIAMSNLTGVLDLTMFDNFSSTLKLNIFSNPLLTGINFSPLASGTALQFIYSGNSNSANFLDISMFNANVNSASWNFNYNGWDAAYINQILSNINSSALGGFTGRIIYISYGNGIPDSTSGGYDGLAAKASLIAKGFDVRTN